MHARITEGICSAFGMVATVAWSVFTGDVFEWSPIDIGWLIQSGFAAIIGASIGYLTKKLWDKAFDYFLNKEKQEQ